MAKQFTWGEAVETTLHTRPTWRNGSGRVQRSSTAVTSPGLRDSAFLATASTSPSWRTLVSSWKRKASQTPRSTVSRLLCPPCSTTAIGVSCVTNLPRSRNAKRMKSPTWFSKAEVDSSSTQQLTRLIARTWLTSSPWLPTQACDRVSC